MRHVQPRAATDRAGGCPEARLPPCRLVRRSLTLLAGVWFGCSFSSPAQELPSAPVPQAPTAPRRSDPQSATARITGDVESEDGTLLAGAQISLSPAAGMTAGATQRVTSDTDGQFVISNLAPGTYTLSVSLSGFTTATRQTVIAEGQQVVLSPTKLSLGTVNIDVTAITPEQASLEQLHIEEHQRLIGLLPNFFVSYSWTAGPLTAAQKYKLATHTVFDPGNLILSGLVAGVQQADNAFPGYGQGSAGYGKRFGADLGNLVIGTYLGGAVLPSLFHQDPRFFYKATGSKRSKFLYAISRAVITRGDNGHQQPNFSGILGDLSAGAISNAYYPASDRQGATLFLENSILAIGGDALNGLVQEFVFNRFTINTRSKKNSPHP